MPSVPGTKLVQFKLPAELHKQLEAAALSCGRTAAGQAKWYTSLHLTGSHTTHQKLCDILTSVVSLVSLNGEQETRNLVTSLKTLIEQYRAMG